MRRFVCVVARCAALAVALCLVVGTAASAQTLPSPWLTSDVGSPSLSGSASHASGVFTIDAAGIDIYGASDQMRFVYQQISGDVEIVAKVDSLVAQHAWTKAGVMIRASLNANSANGYALVSPTSGVRYTYRPSTGAQTTSVVGPTMAPAMWLRAVRAGSVVTTAWSSNGTSWTTIGSSTIALGASAYVGLAVTSHNAAARTTAAISNVRVTQLSLPSGQQSRDIGAPAIAGSASYSGTTYTIKAAGADIWDVADQFHFVYQPMTGNGEVIARVASITNTHAWAKAGVMIRETLTADSKHALVVTSIGKGYAFQRRQQTGDYSVHTTGGTGTAPGWVRLVRTGDLFEAYRSANGTTWTRIASDTIPMGATVYAGLAVTSHNAAAATTAVVDNVRVTASTGGNQPPAVSITAPANGSQPASGSTVTIQAAATDPESRMASVDFYAGTTLISRDTTAPYSAAWVAGAAGNYALTATAHDQDGNSTTSAAVTVTVSASTSTPPRSVVFIAPSDHATNVTNYVLKIFAAGANPATATPIATSDLGKPTPTTAGEITVDRATFFAALAVGSYQATVTSVGPGGQSPSAAIAFTR
jgi:hypothetical protein